MAAFFHRNRVLILHISFWVLYFSYRFYDLQAYLGSKRAATYLGIQLIFAITASYIHYFFILPHLLGKKKPLVYVAKVVLLLAVMVTLRLVTDNVVMSQLMPNEQYYQTIRLARVISTTWDILTFLIFTGMIRFTIDWFDLENKKKQLENEKLVAELNYLKAQINPHFLFNTLHNLNYLIYSKSDRASDVVIRLSNIMRYMIYDAKREWIPITKEIAYMKDYIHLESIRLNQKFEMQFEITGTTDSVKIAPLIMLTFLENAFKHGVSDQEPDCWVRVLLDVREDRIAYEVSNKITRSKTMERSGFGLDNVMKRLALSYPERHSLEVTVDSEIYKVHLTLKPE